MGPAGGQPITQQHWWMLQRNAGLSTRQRCLVAVSAALTTPMNRCNTLKGLAKVASQRLCAGLLGEQLPVWKNLVPEARVVVHTLPQVGRKPNHSGAGARTRWTCRCSASRVSPRDARTAVFRSERVACRGSSTEPTYQEGSTHHFHGCSCCQRLNSSNPALLVLTRHFLNNVWRSTLLQFDSSCSKA